MAAPVLNLNTTGAYGLTNIDNAEDKTTWAGFTDSGGGSPTVQDEADDFIEGTQCVSIKVSGSNQDKGIWFDIGVSTVDMTVTNRHLYIWAASSTKGLLDTIENGGIYIKVASDSSGNNWSKWYVGGNDVTVDGRFIRYVIDLNKAPSETAATAATLSTVRWFGMGINHLAGTAKSENFKVDRMDYGDGFQIEAGDSTTPCSWAELFALDDANKVGIIEERSGVYYLKGSLTIGDPAGTVTTLWDDVSGATVVFEDPQYHNGSALVSAVKSQLYEIEILGNGTGTTDVKWGEVVGTGDDRQGINGGSIQSTRMKWKFNAEVDVADLDTVEMYGMSIKGSANMHWSGSTKETVIGCTFTKCNLLSPNDAVFLNNTIIGPVPGAGLQVISTHNIKQITFVAAEDVDGPAFWVISDDTNVIPVIYIDFTDEFNDATTGDVLAFPAAATVGDSCYFGHDSRFAKLRIDTGTARVGGTLVWEYWSGSGWSSLTTTDGTNTLSTTGLQDVTFTPPSNWTKTDIFDEDRLFYVRIRYSTATMTTSPIIDQGFIADLIEHHLVFPSTGTYAMVDMEFFGFGADGAPKWMGRNDSAGLVTITATGKTNITDAETEETGGGTTTVNNNKDITFSNLIAGSEVRVRLAGTETVVDGIESSGTSFNFSVGSGVSVDYTILGPLADPKVPIRQESISWTADTTIVINQQVNRNFANP